MNGPFFVTPKPQRPGWDGEGWVKYLLKQVSDECGKPPVMVKVCYKIKTWLQSPILSYSACNKRNALIEENPLSHHRCILTLKL